MSETKTNKLPKGAVILSAVVILVVGMSIVFYALYMFRDSQYKNDLYFTFASPESNDESLYKDAETIEKYKSKFSDLSTYTYYNTLNRREKLIYKAFEYAMDNAKTDIFVLNDLIEEGDLPLEDILYFLSLDSPAMDQNFNTSEGLVTDTVVYTDSLTGDHTINNHGHNLTVEKFDPERRRKCELAIDKGREIAKTIPQDLTDVDKAQRIYTYIAENIKYRNDGQGSGVAFDEEHLYNALMTGYTNCDGFSNAISLLCNLSGIPTFEKMTYDPDVGVGHTWDMIRIDDAWYNCDATVASEDINMPVKVNFAFPDELLEYEVDYSDRLPSANRYLTLPDALISGNEADKIPDIVTEAFNRSNKNYVFAVLDFKPENLKSTMADVVSRIKHSITYLQYNGTDKCALLIVKK